MKDSEILKDGADYTVDMDDMFANPSKKRNPLVLCGEVHLLLYVKYCGIFLLENEA